MFGLGLFAGYLVRPLISPQETEVATVPSLPSPEPGQSGNQQVMSFLVEETRHYKGDPDAPVTIIEFSDFK
jgi:protein-disulfide isomerase